MPAFSFAAGGKKRSLARIFHSTDNRQHTAGCNPRLLPPLLKSQSRIGPVAIQIVFSTGTYTTARTASALADRQTVWTHYNTGLSSSHYKPHIFPITHNFHSLTTLQSDINRSLCAAFDIEHVGKVRIQVDSLLRHATQNVHAPLNPKHV